LKRSLAALFLVIIVLAAASASAQVVPSATKGQFSLTAGGLASAFQPDYAGGVDRQGNPIAQTSPNRLYGIGAFVDVRFRRWFQVEAEGRWLRFNQFVDINEDNYLIGPRVPIHTFHFMRATPYAKVLAGFGRMNFQNNEAWGRFTAIAYGGGVDFKLTRRISARGDFEYQQWPNWLNSSLYPYGVSAGVSYRILGGGPGFPRLTKKELQQRE
jgi:opacity protein-like surface antigen